MKILVLHLGGTIACTEVNGLLTPSADISEYFKRLSREYKGISFVHRRPTPFLSEHLDGSLINIAVKEVKKAAGCQKYSGIIVTHGSDTIAYTSCALGYALGNDCTPIITVCADLPLSDTHSSGHINLRAAIAVILSKKARGVFSVYRRSSVEASVYRATRLLRHRAYESELTGASVAYGNVSFIAPENGVFAKNPKFSELPDELAPLDFKLGKTCPISVIQVYPSMVCQRPPRGCRAVILSTYHSGTLDTKNPSIKRLCAHCAKKGIPVFADGIGANADYESMDAFSALGIRRLPSMTSPVAMLIKLWALDACKSGADAVNLSLAGDVLGNGEE